MDKNYKYVFERSSKEYEDYIKAEIERVNTNGKRTVLMVNDTYFPTFDGVTNVMNMYAEGLIKNGYNVVAYVPAYKGKVYVKSYPVIATKSTFSKKLNYQIPAFLQDSKTKKWLALLRIDLIHCHSPFQLGHHAVKIHKKRNVPMVSTFHSQYRKDLEKNIPTQFLVNIALKYLMQTYNGSDYVLTMTSPCEETLYSYGYKGITKILTNGTDFVVPENYLFEREEARKKYGVGDEVLFVFVGRFAVIKNILFIADVLGALKKRGLKFKMIFVGDGPDRKKLEEKISANGVNEETTFLGFVTDKNILYSVYSAADLFLFPSQYDTLSMVQIEAASRYLPCAFVKDSVTSYTVTGGVNGYVFPADVEGYSDGIYSAVSDREKLEEIGKNAHRDLYVTRDEVIQKLLNYYDELLNK